MADWMNDMANAVEEAEAANARAQEEVPTEPALTPRDSTFSRFQDHHDGFNGLPTVYAQILWDVAHEPQRFAKGFRLSTMALYLIGEDEQVGTKSCTSIQTRRDMEKARQQAQAAEQEAHERSIREWDAQIQARGLDTPALPSGPPPQGISSQRVLPQSP